MENENPGFFGRTFGFFGQSWVLAAIVALAAIAWMASGMLAPSPANGDETSQAGETQTASLTEVRVAVFQATQVADNLRLQGRTAADRRVTLKAETSGIIEEILVNRGDKVTKGQIIARLEVDDREARVASAKALMSQREIEFAAALKLNQKGYRGDVDLSQAQAALDAAKAGVHLATIELENIVITAPFDGIMYERDIELGHFVDRGDPICHIVDLSVISAVGQVSERNLGKIRLGQTAQVITMNGRSIEGVVSYIGAVANETTRTFTIEVDVPNHDDSMIEGVTVELNVPLAELTAHTFTPAILTLDDDGTLGVRGVDDTDHVVFYPVHILRDTPDAVVIGGLPERVRLITVGQEYVSSGQQVKPVEDKRVEGQGEVNS